jgi:hypothetical protein
MRAAQVASLGAKRRVFSPFGYESAGYALTGESMADHRDGPIFPDRHFSFGAMAFRLPQFKDPNFALPTTSEVQVFSFEGHPTRG